MKLFNTEDDDLFLHDFSKKDEAASGTAADDSPKPAGQEFTFGPMPGSEKPVGKKKTRRGCAFLGWFAFMVILVLAVAVYVRYFIPHTSESKTVGFITLVEKRGIIFKTYEGEMISETRMADTTKVYSRDLQFSIPDDSLGARVQQYQATGRPVVITTKKFYGTLPWRGATNVILTDIEPQ